MGWVTCRCFVQSSGWRAETVSRVCRFPLEDERLALRMLMVELIHSMAVCMKEGVSWMCELVHERERLVERKVFMDILAVSLRHVLSWPKLSLEPKFHDSGTFFTFFAIDRLGAPKFKKSYFYLKRVQKNFDQKYFFYKGDPPKKWEFFKKNFFAFVNFENIHFVKIS